MFETRQPELRDLTGPEFAENADDYFITPTRAAPMADRRIIWSSIQQIDVVRPAAVAVSPAIPRPC